MNDWHIKLPPMNLIDKVWPEPENATPPPSETNS